MMMVVLSAVMSNLVTMDLVCVNAYLFQDLFHNNFASFEVFLSSFYPILPVCC